MNIHMLEFSDQQFREVKEKAESFYRTVSDVYCPFLGEEVSFGSPGLEHIKFKKHEKTSSKQDQYMRFKLLHLAPEVLRFSHTLRGFFVGVWLRLGSRERANPPNAGRILSNLRKIVKISYSNPRMRSTSWRSIFSLILPIFALN